MYTRCCLWNIEQYTVQSRTVAKVILDRNSLQVLAGPGLSSKTVAKVITESLDFFEAKTV